MNTKSLWDYYIPANSTSQVKNGMENNVKPPFANNSVQKLVQQTLVNFTT
jgi:hypothetical protein